jgi:dienelactone hydrolase
VRQLRVIPETTKKQMAATSPCCPPTSHPSLADNYTPQGTKVTYKSVEFYAIGNAKSNGNAIVIFSDIWGWDSGRIRRYADYLADTVADYVVIPKLLLPTLDGGTDGDALAPGIDLSERGSDVWPWLAQFSYQFLSSKIDDVFDHLQAQEIARIGLLGVCYGGYLACHSAVNYPNIVCGVIPHPSIHVEEALMGGNNAELAKKV